MRYRRVGNLWQYEAGSLLAARDEASARRLAGNRRGGPGPGRPRHRDRPRIAEMLAEGISRNEVARLVGCSAALVTTVKNEMKEMECR